MAQVRVNFKNGTREDIDVETEASVTGKVEDGRVGVYGQRVGQENVGLLGSYPTEEVEDVVTTIWTSSDV
jgi:hypothetical protein